MTSSNSSISKHYHQLTSVQRGQIQAMLDSGITSRTVIAQEVGCHKSTISREIKRGSVLQRDICCMSTITLILHRFIMRSVAKTAISVIH